MRMSLKLSLSGLAIAVAAATGCRGGISEKPPIHPVLDMDFQQKLKAQSYSDFANWKDHRGMRPSVENTVKRRTKRQQYLAAHPELTTFKDGAAYVTTNPVQPTEANLERGRQKFFTFCAPCHGQTGHGGLVAERWPTPIPDLVKDKKGQPHGQVYETIYKGRGLMPAYGKAIDPEDIWRVVHFLKTLQTID